MAIEDLKAQIARLPEQPGVYLYANRAGETIYVGKARALRDRVRSYLGARGTSPKTEALLDEIAGLEVIVTDSVVEALALENNLIKERSPKYNIKLRDDKTYPYLRLSTSEAFPRVSVVRRVADDGDYYAGPFMPASLAWQTRSLSHKLFGIRSCREVITGQRGRPVPGVRHQALPGAVRRVDLHAATSTSTPSATPVCCSTGAPRNSSPTSSRACTRRPTRSASSRRRSCATRSARSRRCGIASRRWPRRAWATATRSASSWAPAAPWCRRSRCGRGASWTASRWSPTPIRPATRGSRTSSSGRCTHFYADHAPPPEVLLPLALADVDLLAEWLSARAGRQVVISVPQRGDKRALLELAERNASLSYDARFNEDGAANYEALETLQAALGLAALPRRIDCFDISTLQGAETVASMVVCQDGRMKRSEYRKFRIQERDRQPATGHRQPGGPRQRATGDRQRARAGAEGDLPGSRFPVPGSRSGEARRSRADSLPGRLRRHAPGGRRGAIGRWPTTTARGRT